MTDEVYVFPMSFAQERLWFLDQLEPGKPMYNIPVAIKLIGSLNVPVLEQSLNELINRHESLRTTFTSEDGQPVQVIASALSMTLPAKDLRNIPKEKQSIEIRNLISKESLHSFDLANGPLLRVTLLYLDEEEYVLLATMHHIITDGWSMGIFIRELTVLYETFLSGASSPLLELPIQYADYSDWQRKWLQGGVLDEQLEYWKQQLAGAPPVLELPLDRQRLAVRTSVGGIECFTINPEVAQRLKEMSKQSDSSLFMTLFAAFMTFLYRYTGKEDLLSASLIANRNRNEIESLIGFFVNTLPLRVDVSGNPSFRELLARMKQVTVDAYDHQDVPFGQLIEAMQPERHLNHFPLVQVMFVLQNVPMEKLELPGLTITSITDLENTPVRFDLEVYLWESSDSITGNFIYKTDIFEKSTIKRMLRHFLAILEGIAHNQDQRVSELPLISEIERQQLLIEWNNTDADYPKNSCIHELFEEQVKRTPGNIAIEYQDKQLTYEELNARANQVGRVLRAEGIKENSIVGIMMNRSPDMLIGIFGILKAGGAYLPIDLKYPEARVEYIVKDSSINALLTHDGLSKQLKVLQQFQGKIIDLNNAEIDSQNLENLEAVSSHSETAYVIYTSGSTGKPKGTIVPHMGVVNYAWWARDQYLQDEVLDFPLFTSLSFDLTVTSIFVPLISGGKVVIYEEVGQDGDPTILKVVEDNAVDIIKLTPAHLSLLKEFNINKSRIKRLIVGGEDLKSELAKTIQEVFKGNIEIYNEYGPTETTVGCMIHKYNPKEDVALSVPIGKPVNNVKVYLLDKFSKPVPVGVTGEIHVSGDGVAKGYLKKDEETSERFIPNPFSPGKRMYRTGDTARWVSEKKMEFLGRTDNQLKIRGVRIELGEIEAELSAHDDVNACIVNAIQKSATVQDNDEVTYCSKCGLPSNYPGAVYDSEGVCNTCLAFEGYKSKVMPYFKTKDDLKDIFEKLQATNNSEYDCIVLFSGGKDSTYMLYQLAEMNLKILAFTLDNGYLYEGARKNIKRVESELNVDHVFGSSPPMNEILADSLKRFSNVCNACFKTVYTLAMNLAYEKKIKYIVTGLSRGQLFETRLGELYRNNIFDPTEIDRTVLEARKLYHRMDDIISRSLDVDKFQQDSFFEDIHFIDFYRYTDVKQSEIYEFLEKYVPWVNPTNSGCTTNCLINDAGIYVHTKERGFHNYALPTCWDVRLGHITREDALKDLKSDVDVDSVEKILKEIGYDEYKQRIENREKCLVAYYVSNKELAASELNAFLSQKLPDYMVPLYYIRIETIPLTPNGKVDRNVLPVPEQVRPVLESSYVAPRTPVEQQLATIWSQVLGFEQIGIHDNFFKLGGHSLLATQVVSQISQDLKVELPLRSIFDKPTIAELTEQVVADQMKGTEEEALADILAEVDSLSDDDVKRQLQET